MKKETEKNAALHQGHRARMQEKFLNIGPSSFADHEILEMLLYSVFPRQDTNELAHILLETFGSLSKVLDADPRRIAALPGFGERSAYQIAVLGEISRRYTTEKMCKGIEKSAVTTMQDAAELLFPYFVGQSKERACVVLLDSNLCVTDRFFVGDGSVNSILISLRNIVERAVMKHAVAVILAHNHPNGKLEPSNSDIATTLQLRDALKLVDIDLIEHFIFNDYQFLPFMDRLEGMNTARFMLVGEAGMGEIRQEARTLTYEENETDYL